MARSRCSCDGYSLLPKMGSESHHQGERRPRPEGSSVSQASWARQSPREELEPKAPLPRAPAIPLHPSLPPQRLNQRLPERRLHASRSTAPPQPTQAHAGASALAHNVNSQR